MHYAIIAAGEGSRLQQEGVREPKPLVRLNGEAMIDRLVRIFLENNALSVSIIVNREMKEVQEHIAKWKLPVPLHLIVKSTPSSMHSFHALSEVIAGEPFCLTTVDTIFMPEEFSRFIDFVTETKNYDGVMGVTSFVDDEKPLWVKTDGNDEITAFLDRNDGTCRYVSGGIYCLGGKALDTLNACMEKGMSRMRNYQRALLEDGNELKAWNFCKIMDIDHAADIKKAEQFLQL